MLAVLWTQALVGAVLYALLRTGAFSLSNPQPWQTAFLTLTLVSGLLLLAYGALALYQRLGRPSALPVPASTTRRSS